METAHAAAIVELPRVRARFRSGFRSGEDAAFKHECRFTAVPEALPVRPGTPVRQPVRHNVFPAF